MKKVAAYLTGLVLLLAACHPGGFLSHPPKETPTAPVDFDPLATAADREVVPETYPLRPHGATADSRAGDTTAALIGPIDVYRVDIFASRLYGEAQREQAIAAEVFKLPVHVDYEVPYYKVRVGDFATRGEAEQIIEGIRTIGYPSAWVSRAVLKVNPPPPIDSVEAPLIPVDSGGVPPPPSEPLPEPRQGGIR